VTIGDRRVTRQATQPWPAATERLLVRAPAAGTIHPEVRAIDLPTLASGTEMTDGPMNSSKPCSVTQPAASAVDGLLRNS
jgi:hypothetical protein